MQTPVVTLTVWRVPLARVPAALRHARRWHDGMTFRKALGTGTGFLPHQPDVTRWARLAVWSGRPRYDDLAHATETWTVELRPLSSRGRWARQEPFGDPRGEHDDTHAGPTAVLTRARVRPSRARVFYGDVPAVARSLDAASGVRVLLPLGEAPTLLQGTFSVWETPAHLRAFAHTGPHRDAIVRTTEVGWYAEELFARFAVEASTGTLDGRDPLA